MEYLNQIIEGNCLEVMKSLPDSSIDLIATDPPYLGVKGGGSKGQFEWWDRQWDKPVEFLKWIDQLAEQWQRILKPNGSLYCFASPKMSARVEVLLAERFNVLNNITWAKPCPFSEINRGASNSGRIGKESLRAYYPNTESIIFCEHYGADSIAKGDAGYQAKCDEAARDTWGYYIKQVRQRHGLTAKQLTEVVGAYGKVNHGGACSNWEQGKNCPTLEHYTKLQQAFPGYFTRPYEDLRQQYEELRQQYEELRQQYEELRRPFSVSADVPYTDVWTYPTVNHYPGKHPCEKPLEMMEHIVQASSRPGGVILDCFCGSGNTLVAAKKHDRQFIGIDIDPHWVDVSRGKLGQTQRFIATEDRLQWLELQLQVQGKKIKRLEEQQLSLFQGDHISAKLRIS